MLADGGAGDAGDVGGLCPDDVAAASLESRQNKLSYSEIEMGEKVSTD